MGQYFLDKEIDVGDPSRISKFFRMVVMQHATYCNLNCGYCYLPGRKMQNTMDIEIAHRVASDIAAQATKPGAPEHVTLMWHCSEPLADTKAHFVSLLKPFEFLRRAGLVRHGVQTNGTLVDPEWCDILHNFGFEVGVSLDGPEEMNTHRVNWAGRPAFRQIMDGIRYLQSAMLDPAVIAVITPDTVTRGREIIQFFHEQGFTRIALNMEERDGVNLDRPLISRTQAIQFWDDVFEYITETEAPIQLRELTSLGNWELNRAAPDRDPVPTVTWAGDVVLAAPELAGVHEPRFADFVVANIRQTSLAQILDSVHQIPYIKEFQDGLAQCKAHCSFWQACHGSYASNRWAEHGRLDVMETNTCQTTRQAPAEALHNLALRHGDTMLESKLAPLIPLSRRNA